MSQENQNQENQNKNQQQDLNQLLKVRREKLAALQNMIYHITVRILKIILTNWKEKV